MLCILLLSFFCIICKYNPIHKTIIKIIIKLASRGYDFHYCISSISYLFATIIIFKTLCLSPLLFYLPALSCLLFIPSANLASTSINDFLHALIISVQHRTNYHSIKFQNFTHAFHCNIVFHLPTQCHLVQQSSLIPSSY